MSRTKVAEFRTYGEGETTFCSRWQGLHTSNSSKTEKAAQIQASVPAAIVFSDDAPRWLVQTLWEALDLCEKKRKRQKYPLDRKLHEDAFAEISEALGVTA